MRNSHQFFSLAHLFTILLLTAMGACAFSLAFSPQIASVVSHILHREPNFFIWLGIFFLASAFFLSLSLQRIYRGRYLELEGGEAEGGEAFVDINLIRSRLEEVFFENGHFNLLDLELKGKKKLHLVAQITGREFTPEYVTLKRLADVFSKKNSQQEDDLSQTLSKNLVSLDRELKDVLSKEFGYERKYLLTLMERS